MNMSLYARWPRPYGQCFRKIRIHCWELVSISEIKDIQSSTGPFISCLTILQVAVCCSVRATRPTMKSRQDPSEPAPLLQGRSTGLLLPLFSHGLPLSLRGVVTSSPTDLSDWPGGPDRAAGALPDRPSGRCRATPGPRPAVLRENGWPPPRPVRRPVCAARTG